MLRGFRMSHYWIIPAFMHGNAAKRGGKKKKEEKKRLGNGKIEMFKGKLKRRQTELAGPQIFVLQMDLLLWQARQLCSQITSC